MGRFKYLNIDDFTSVFKHSALVEYTMDLQRHSLAQGELIREQTETLAKSDSSYYIAEARQMRQENIELYKANGKLQGEIEALKIEKKALQEQYQNRIDALKDSQVIEVINEEPKKEDFRTKDRQRDSHGRLLPSGSSKEDRKRLCYRLVREVGMTYEDVAAEIGNISPKSVKTYVNEYEREQAQMVQALEDKEAYQKYLEDFGVYIGD